MKEKEGDRGFSIDEIGLLCVVVFVLCVVVLMAVHIGSSDAQVPATMTPRPTGLPGTPTHEVFLPLVECERPATATPIPRPTMVVK